MNPKIIKLRGELDKNATKIAALQAKNKEIEKQIREQENTEIIGMIRESGITMDAFTTLFQQMKGTPAQNEEKESGNET